IPNFCEIFGVRGDKKANANSGTVVIVPSKALETATSSRMKGMSDPIAVKGARKLAPTNIIPSIMSIVAQLEFFCLLGVSMISGSPTSCLSHIPLMKFLFESFDVFIYVIKCSIYIFFFDCFNQFIMYLI